MTVPLTLAVFALSWWLMAVRRVPFLPIGRAAGAALGATLMVVVGALTPDQAFAAVDLSTLALLLGMMIQTDFLAEAGVFERVSTALLRRARSGFSLLVWLALVSAALSAFLVNDTICLFLTPVVVAICRQGGLPPVPYLLALASSANLGSAATLVGNPQNMLIGRMSGLPFATFAGAAVPATLAGVLVNLLCLYAFFGRRLPVRLTPPTPTPRRPLPAYIPVAVLGTMAAFFAGAHLGFAALAGAVVMLVCAREDARPRLARLDFSLLVFFAGLFVVVRGLQSTGLVDQAWAAVAPHLDLRSPGGASLFSGVMGLGSNVVSNVPLVLLVGPQMHGLAGPGADALAYVALAYVTTVAGNLTLIGSVANLIVAEGAASLHPLGFVEHLRFGVPSTLLAMAAGVGVLLALN